MLKLFEPQGKIQKDRQIIRDTDMRMAKYSRRGLISNVLIYTLCLLVEPNFIHRYPNLAIVLTVGLLFATAIRGFLLFRMDAIYPRAPNSWRNKYFFATLVGAAWWGVILSSVTLLMDMQGEASLMWLYTVVFFSTTAHAFAPYQRFLSIYQFLGIVPAACCTFFIGEFIGVFYGSILLFFYWILNHHCELIAHNYWDRLEAHYVLARKTETLEEEKRDSIASSQLANDYLQLLSQKMSGLLSGYREDTSASPVIAAGERAAFEQLYHNIDDFTRVLTKGLVVQSRVFNIRHYLQNLVRGLVVEAERKGIELETALSPALPSRLRGDARRIGQIVSTMVKSSVQQGQGGGIFVEVEFMREYEDAGELHVTIARQSEQEKRLFFHSEMERGIVADLDLILAKGLAEAMKGSLEINESGARDGKNIRLRVPLTIAEPDGRPEYHRLHYKGRVLLLVHPNPRWLDHKRLELDAMGFTVHTANHFRKAFQMLLEAVAAGKAIEGVVYYAASGDDQPVQFCNDLLSHAELKYVHQFVISSEIGRKFYADRVPASPLIHFVAKPAGIFEFEISSATVFEESKTGGETGACRIVWLGAGKSVDGGRLSEDTHLTIQRVNDIRQLAKVVEEGDCPLFIVENTGSEDVETISLIRSLEQKFQRENLVTVVGVGPAHMEAALLEAGADHFIDIESLVTGDTREMRYWTSGRHH